MIHSDRQYNISKIQLAKFKEALAVAQNRVSERQWLKKAEIDALESQIVDIEREMMEYDLLKSGEMSFSKTCSLENLPRMLVQARIASGMSQTDLAGKLNLKPQQIQRYETSGYMGASLGRLIEISSALGVNVSSICKGSQWVNSSVFTWGDVADVVWERFPHREMRRRKWFTVSKGENFKDAIKKYFLYAAGPRFATVYHRKKMHSGNVSNEYALLAWQARILEKAREMIKNGKIAEFMPDDRWLQDLVELTTCKEGPVRAKCLLADKGIPLVIERHFPGTCLDGAAMLNDEEDAHPIIGLTLRCDRLDNFWFTLLHELGHVFLHLFTGANFDFFDEGENLENDKIGDKLEKEADRFALNTLIPGESWKQCLSRFALSGEAVKIDAESLGVGPSIVAGRIRRERNNYTIMSDLIGQGQVRYQFDEVANDLE